VETLLGALLIVAAIVSLWSQDVLPLKEIKYLGYIIGRLS
jgi:hypothetical protein